MLRLVNSPLLSFVALNNICSCPDLLTKWHSKTWPAKNATSLAVRYSGCLLTPDYDNWWCSLRWLKHLMLYPLHFCLLNYVFGTGAHCWRANHLASRTRDDSTGGWDMCCWDYFLRSQVFSLTSKQALWVNFQIISIMTNCSSIFVHESTFFYSRLNEPGQATPQKDNDNEQDVLPSTPQPAPRQPIAKTRWAFKQSNTKICSIYFQPNSRSSHSKFNQRQRLFNKELESVAEVGCKLFEDCVKLY